MAYNSPLAASSEPPWCPIGSPGCLMEVLGSWGALGVGKLCTSLTTLNILLSKTHWVWTQPAPRESWLGAVHLAHEPRFPLLHSQEAPTAQGHHHLVSDP